MISRFLCVVNFIAFGLLANNLEAAWGGDGTTDSVWSSGGTAANQYCFNGSYADYAADEVVVRTASQHDTSYHDDDCGSYVTHYVESLNDSDEILACHNQLEGKFGGVPAGWVVTEHDNSSNDRCYYKSSNSITQHYTDTILKLSSLSGTRQTICSMGTGIGFNVSDLVSLGWIVTSTIPSKTCGGSYVPRELRKAASGLKMCANADMVPFGFAISAISSSSACSTALFGTAKAYTLERIPEIGFTYTCVLPTNASEYAYEKVSNNAGVCANGPRYKIGRAYAGGYSCSVPAGWGATQILSTDETNFDCPTNQVYKLAELADGLQTCYLEGNQAPEGYIVSKVEVNETSKCNGSTRYTINVPQSGDFVCDNYSDLPEGFWFGEKLLDYNGCSSGYFLTTIPSSGASVCGEPASPPPEGYVYTSISDFNGCPGSQKQYTVGLASGKTPICYVYNQNGPIPQGYVITADLSGANCAAGESLTIDIARDGLAICRSENLPGNFAIENVINNSSSSCSDYSLVITELDGYGPYIVCSTNNIPNGYVVTGVDSGNYACDGTAFIIEKPQGEITMCPAHPISQTGLPVGMVVLQVIEGNSSCYLNGTGDAYRLGYPQGETVACDTAPNYEIPEGFEVVNTGIYNDECAGGTGRLIRPSAITPNTFILPEPNIAPGDVNTINYDCGGSAPAGIISGASQNSIDCP